MFKPVLAVAFAAVLSVSLAFPASADHYEVDPSHSSVGFSVMHFGVAETRGRFDDFAGTFELSDEAFAIEVAVQAVSLNTNSEARDTHLKNADFFDVENHPAITFKSTSAQETKGGWDVDGELTLLGVTRPIEVVVRKVGEGETAYGYRAGLTCEFIINRSDFGMTWGVDNETVGDEVTLTIALEGVKAE
ncbi:MAG: YceI family protein [Planctomycetota bacterium]